MLHFIMKLYNVVTLPVSIFFILNSAKLHPAYRMTAWRKLRLGLSMFWNRLRIQTGTLYRAHMAMALKILETPPDVPGDLLECGCWKGGGSANLSLVWRIAGRKLVIYDSFEGLPDGAPGDREADGYEKGDYCGTLDEVRENIGRCGAIECCEFIQGWFEQTLPGLNRPILLAFLDVDLEASLVTCVRYIWPNSIDTGYMFTDECVTTDYVALFWPERWWRENFDRTPPGLIGSGTGLPLGDFYIGPWAEQQDHPLQHASTSAYKQKSMSGHWAYYPDES